MPSWVTQLRKGIVEYAVRLLLESEEDYALNLFRRLNEYPCFQVSESTVYPILGRLKKEGKLSARVMPSNEGPPRRYLSLTDAGRQQLKQMRLYLDDVNQSIVNITNMKRGSKR